MAGQKILVVDDMVISLATIERTLKDMYEIITVNSGARAIRFLDIEKPDLILLDIRMAGKNGIETLREMRKMQNGKDIPVIMITSAQDKRSVIESSKLGIYDYVLKPFDPRDLRSRIHYVLTKAEIDRKARLLEEEKNRENAAKAGETGKEDAAAVENSETEKDGVLAESSEMGKDHVPAENVPMEAYVDTIGDDKGTAE